MRFLVLLAVLGSAPLGAQSPWVLATGPTLVEAVPLEPVELVTAWRALYQADDDVWVYLTRSPHFFAQASNVVKVDGTPWTLVVLTPKTWGRPQTAAWVARWTREFLSLRSLPSVGPGDDPVFPAVLRTE